MADEKQPAKSTTPSTTDAILAILEQNGIDPNDPKAVAAYFDQSQRGETMPPKLEVNDIYRHGRYVLDYLPGGPKYSDPEVVKANNEVKKVNRWFFVAYRPEEYVPKGSGKHAGWEVWVQGQKDNCNGFVEQDVRYASQKSRVDGSICQRQIVLGKGEKLDMAELTKVVKSFGK